MAWQVEGSRDRAGSGMPESLHVGFYYEDSERKGGRHERRGVMMMTMICSAALQSLLMPKDLPRQTMLIRLK